MKHDYSYGPILESYYRRRFIIFFGQLSCNVIA